MIMRPPPHLLRRLGHFDLDPCPLFGTGGLEMEWVGRVWLNPPYSLVGPFMKKLAEHGNGMALIFGRTDTRWFHDHVFAHATSILFIKGRIRFFTPEGVEAKWNGGAASVLIAYGEYNHEVLAQPSVREMGHLVRLKGNL